MTLIPSRSHVMYYGQIRPGNFDALTKHYGHEPPWPLDESPHVSLVHAILHDMPVERTRYFDYLLATHRDARNTLTRQVDTVRSLLCARSLSVDVEHESILDGNHRMAVSVATKKPCEIVQRKPYQTLEFPNMVVEGRRFLRELDYDFTGKRVLDLGCAQGMASVNALRQGADSVIAVDADLRSTTWQLRDAWGFKDRMQIIVKRIDDFQRVDVDIVLACSIYRHIEHKDFVRLTSGIPCIFETHSAERPPNTHTWTMIGEVAYSRAEHTRKRYIYLGRP